MQISVFKIWCVFGCLGLLPLSVFATILTKVTTSNVVYTGWNKVVIPLSLVFEWKCDVCHQRSRLLRGSFKRQAAGRGGSCLQLLLSNSDDNNLRFLRASNGFIGSTNAMEDPSSKLFLKNLVKCFNSRTSGKVHKMSWFRYKIFILKLCVGNPGAIYTVFLQTVAIRSYDTVYYYIFKVTIKGGHHVILHDTSLKRKGCWPIGSK